nr:hypothetical protein [Nostoc sp. 'Peltigera malacea cyanobiont' DB3992]
MKRRASKAQTRRQSATSKTWIVSVLLLLVWTAFFYINPAFAPNEAELGVAMVEAAKTSAVRICILWCLSPLALQTDQSCCQASGGRGNVRVGYGVHRAATVDVYAELCGGLGCGD